MDFLLGVRQGCRLLTRNKTGTSSCHCEYLAEKWCGIQCAIFVSIHHDVVRRFRCITMIHVEKNVSSSLNHMPPVSSSQPERFGRRVLCKICARCCLPDTMQPDSMGSCASEGSQRNDRSSNHLTPGGAHENDSLQRKYATEAQVAFHQCG